jgi:chromosomal replication initiator protein
MKMAILRTKAKAEGVKLSDDVTEWLASVSGSNIRELEGFLNRIIAVSSLTSQDITLATSKDALKKLIRGKKQKILSIDAIQKTVAAFFNIKPSELKSKRRHKTIAFPRQIAMYLAREYGKFSFLEIGSSFGGKDHSTAVHAHKKIKNSINEDTELKRNVVAIKNHLE